MASIQNGRIVSFSNTPQANGDAYSFTEDQLLSFNLFSSSSDVLSFNVMANDLGGKSKTLYSVDDGVNYLKDLLNADALTNGVSTWEAIGGGDTIRIDRGMVDVDLSASIFALTGTTNINALSAGDHIHDTFVYAIQLGNGALSWARVTLDIQGSNDAPVIDTSGHAGNFSPPAAVLPPIGGGQGTYIAVGDVNGDGIPDIVREANLSNVNSVALGHGDGTFGTPTNYQGVPGATPDSVALADLNGDGKPDIVVSDGLANSISVLLNNGDGTFASPVTYSTGPEAGGLAFGDLNGDGKMDVVVANQGSSTISVLLGNGDGTFSSQTQYGVTFGPFAVKVADVNGDGKLDVIVGDNHSNAISVLLGDGSGTFPTHTDYTAFTFGFPGHPFGMQMGDFNGDGKPDIVTGNQESGSHELSVLLNNGDGTYGAPIRIGLSFGVGGGIAVTDLDGDGKLDLLVGASDDGAIHVLLGNGDGTFTAGPIYATPGATSPAEALGSIVPLDINGDGKTDILFSDHGGSVWAMLGQSSSGLTATIHDNPSLPTLTAADQFHFSDVDLTDIHSVSVTPHQGAIGTLIANVSQDTSGTGTGGAVAWNYQAVEANVHVVGVAVTDSFDVTVHDNHGGVATAMVNILLLPFG